MTPTDIMYAAAEAEYKNIGERHGYSGLVVGAAEVLRRRGVDTGGKELAMLFHDPLADFGDMFLKGDLPFDRVADAMNYPPRGGRLDAPVTLPHPFDRIAENYSFPYPLDRAIHPSVSVSWIAGEWQRYLKQEKVRKGTKRYRELIEKSRSKILGAAQELAAKAFAEARKTYEKNIVALDKLHDQALAGLAYRQRYVGLRRAFVDAADLKPNAPLVSREDEELRKWQLVIKQIEEHAAYMESGLVDFNVEQAAREALAADQDLSVFV